jgi:hypothetical protein
VYLERSDVQYSYDTCHLGDDLENAVRGEITIYHFSSFAPAYPGACNLDREYLKKHNSKALEYYAALPKDPTEGDGKKQGGIEFGANCGRCIKVS